MSDFLPLHRHGIPVNLPYPDDTFISARYLAHLTGRTAGATASFLNRLAVRLGPDCRIEVPNPRRGEPSYLYRVNWIWGAVVLWMREHDPRKAEQADAGLADQG